LNQKDLMKEVEETENHSGYGDDKKDAGLHVEGCDSDHPMCQFYA